MSFSSENTPFQQAWKRFRKNKMGMISLIFILLITLAATLSYLIMPDDTPAANAMCLQASTHHPGSTVNFLLIRKNERIDTLNSWQKMLHGQPAFFDRIPIHSYKLDGWMVKVREYTGNDVEAGVESSFPLVDVVYALAEEPDYVYRENSITFTNCYGKREEVAQEKLQELFLSNHLKKRTFIMGTDRYGRDLFSRLILGTRVSLAVGFIAVFISLAIGIVLGALAGFYRGKVDQFITWLINVIWSLPALLLVIAISFALGKGFWQVFIAVGLTMWVDVARMVRGQILSIREVEFVEAARAMGFKPARIIFRHILPNIIAPVLVVTSANFASAILLEAGLSFLGFGVQPPFPSWGGMIKEHYGYIVIDAAYLAIYPGIAIMLLVYAFNMLSNAIRDTIDLKESIISV